MLDLIAQLLAAAAAVVIIWRAEPALSRMSRCTPLMVRCAFWLLAVGAAGAILCIVSGDVPPWPAIIGAWGAAALLFCERRLRYLTRPPQKKRYG